MPRYEVTFEVDFDSTDSAHSLIERVREKMQASESISKQELAEIEEDYLKELIEEDLAGLRISGLSKPEVTRVVRVP